jgi:hypothetical protein
MKITATDNNTTKVRPYPKLMATPEGRIVLMKSYGHGTELITPRVGQVGRYEVTWIMSDFKDYEGVLTMENDK